MSERYNIRVPSCSVYLKVQSIWTQTYDRKETVRHTGIRTMSVKDSESKESHFTPLKRRKYFNTTPYCRSFVARLVHLHGGKTTVGES